MCVSCYSYLLGFPQRAEEVFINQNLGKYNLYGRPNFVISKRALFRKSICGRFIDSQDRSACLAAGKLADRLTDPGNI
jgi:hypothetical protein